MRSTPGPGRFSPMIMTRRPAYPQQNGSSSYIGEAKAKSIALSAAGFSSGQVSNIRCYLEQDDGRWEYTVEFWQERWSMSLRLMLTPARSSPETWILFTIDQQGAGS